MRRKEPGLIDSVRSATSRGVNKISGSLGERFKQQLQNLRSEGQDSERPDVDYPGGGERLDPSKEQKIKDNRKELLKAGDGTQGAEMCECPDCDDAILLEDTTVSKANIKESSYFGETTGGISVGGTGEVTSGAETTQGIEAAAGTSKRIPYCQNRDCTNYIPRQDRLDYALEETGCVERVGVQTSESETVNEQDPKPADETQSQEQSQDTNSNQKEQNRMKGMEQDIDASEQRSQDTSM